MTMNSYLGLFLILFWTQVTRAGPTGLDLANAPEVSELKDLIANNGGDLTKRLEKHVRDRAPAVRNLTWEDDNVHATVPLLRCSREKFDAMNRLLVRVQVLGFNDFAAPKNDQEMRKFCIDVKRLLSLFNDFSKECLEPFARQMASIAVRLAMRTQRVVCRDKKNRLEALAHFQCIVPNESDALHNCAHAAAQKAQWLARDEEGILFGKAANEADGADQFLPALCCLFHQGVDCLVSAAPNVCAGRVRNPQETIKYMLDMTLGAAGEAIEWVCGRRFSGLDQCRAHLPRPMAVAFDSIDEGFTRGQTVLNRTSLSSVPLPLLALFQRLDGLDGGTL